MERELNTLIASKVTHFRDIICPLPIGLPLRLSAQSLCIQNNGYFLVKLKWPSHSVRWHEVTLGDWYGSGGGFLHSFRSVLSNNFCPLSAAQGRLCHARVSWNVSMKRALRMAQQPCLQAKCEKNVERPVPLLASSSSHPQTKCVSHWNWIRVLKGCTSSFQFGHESLV